MCFEVVRPTSEHNIISVHFATARFSRPSSAFSGDNALATDHEHRVRLWAIVYVFFFFLFFARRIVNHNLWILYTAQTMGGLARGVAG